MITKLHSNPQRVRTRLSLGPRGLRTVSVKRWRHNLRHSSFPVVSLKNNEYIICRLTFFALHATLRQVNSANSLGCRHFHITHKLFSLMLNRCRRHGAWEAHLIAHSYLNCLSNKGHQHLLAARKKKRLTHKASRSNIQVTRLCMTSREEEAA